MADKYKKKRYQELGKPYRIIVVKMDPLGLYKRIGMVFYQKIPWGYIKGLGWYFIKRLRWEDCSEDYWLCIGSVQKTGVDEKVKCNNCSSVEDIEINDNYNNQDPDLQFAGKKNCTGCGKLLVVYISTYIEEKYEPGL